MFIHKLHKTHLNSICVAARLWICAVYSFEQLQENKFLIIANVWNVLVIPSTRLEGINSKFRNIGKLTNVLLCT